jgi:hypothetical protein
MSTEDDALSSRATTEIGVARLIVGLAQGLALYFLYSAMEDHTWPSEDGLVFAPLAFLAAYVPLIVILSIGNLRIVTLIVWSVLAAGIVAGLAWYDIWHDPGTSLQLLTPGHWGVAPRIFPNFATWFFTSAGIFIAQSLIVGGDTDRRVIADYATHFDVAWKLGLQLFLASIFVSIFWAVLLLGATLFHIIGIDYFRNLIEHRWFAIPATTLAQAAAIHLTDVRASLVRGTRTLVLVLLSWLLPLMTIVGAGFLIGLVTTGLAPLWKTGFAGGYLLIASGLLVFLINTAFQDGAPERRPVALLRYAGSLASMLLVPLVALSAYAIYLRVAQYGWTTSRVASAACLVVAASYAVGYALAAVPGGPWLGRVARWNFFTALLVLAVIGAVFSPLADPIRVSVDSQVDLLQSGKVDAAKFDFTYLRWSSGRFGTEALKRLAVDARAPDVRARARTALAETSRYPFMAMAQRPTTGPAEADNFTVYPKGHTLPPSFLRQTWTFIDGTPCLTSANLHCDAYLLDLAGDGHIEIALIGENPGGGPYFANGLFEEQPNGTWTKVGRPDPIWACPSVAAQLQAGNFRLIPPAQARLRVVVAGSQTLPIAPMFDTRAIVCPK